MKPYYSDKSVTIYQGDAFKIIPRLPLVDVVITDPPYGEQTTKGARTAKTDGSVPVGSAKLVNFAPFEGKDLLRMVKLLARITRRWLVMTVDYRHVHLLEDKTPEGWKFVRMGIWEKVNAAPQFTGDRPGMGWEAIVFMHKEGVATQWNGGGRSSVFRCPVERGQHPTQKPTALISEFVQLFSNPGDVVLDPFMGSGTVLKVAKELERRSVGIDLDPVWADRVIKRTAQEVFPFLTEQSQPNLITQ